MKIGNWNISFDRVENASKKQSNEQIVLKKIIRSQLTRSRAEIKDWTAATQSAESIQNPNRRELIRIFNDIVVDSHLTSVMNTLKLKVISANAKIYSGDAIDETASKLIETYWFRKILESFVDSEFYGYSLIQLGDFYGQKTSIEFIPREYVIPEKRLIKTSLNSIDSTISIDDPQYTDWLIFSDSGTLGLLHKAAPLIIMKKNVMSAWSEYAEIFGLPMRIGKTDIRDPQRYKNMDNMLANMGSAAYGVFDPSDMIEFVETSKGDAFNVFNEFAKSIDQQISKLILGQTGTTDEKSFAGSANVHAGILDEIVSAYIQKMTFFVNDIVFPTLQKHGIVQPNHVFGVQDENQVSKMLSAMSDTVASKVMEKMTADEIRELIGLAPDPNITKQSTQQQGSVMNVVSKLYADALHNCETDHN